MKPEDNISTHFTYGEVIHSNLAKGIGLNNEPSVDLLPKFQAMADKLLEIIRTRFNKPITITSWYRNPQLNQMLGSKSTSQHVKGEAVDFVIPGIQNIEIAKFIKDNLEFDQLILERSWIHLSLISENNRKEVLTCLDGRTYKKGLK